MFDSELSLRDTYDGLRRPATHNLRYFLAIIGLGLVSSLLEGIGISFILPIIEQSRGATGSDSEIVVAMTEAYNLLGVPFTLQNVILGASVVIVARFTLVFLQQWMVGLYRADYVRELRTRLVDAVLAAEIGYLESGGIDQALNGVVTESLFAGRVVKQIVKFARNVFMTAAYLGVAFYISPLLTVLTVGLLGGIGYLIRGVLQPAYAVGTDLKDANERVHGAARSVLRGNREVRRFGIEDAVRRDFRDAVDDFVASNVLLLRNKALIQNAYRMINALTVFGMTYVGLVYTPLGFAELAVFLVAVFRLSPKISQLNTIVYNVNGNLAHVIEVHEATEDIARHAAEYPGDASIDGPVESVEFDDVTYSYDGRENAVEDVSLSVESGEQIALLGRSGAGKSTLISLFTRMYDPDDGEIRIDGQPLDTFDVREWRERVAVVPQDPHVFDETLRYNVMIGNLDATEAEFERACEIARVTDFLDELSEGYDTELGEDADTLSGGQRQRIAIARAMLKDADLLIFDEATSELDAELEAEIHETVENTGRYDMSVFVSHRLETLTDVDRIYFIQDGRVTETGTHQELTARGDEYAKLYAQT